MPDLANFIKANEEAKDDLDFWKQSYLGSLKSLSLARHPLYAARDATIVADEALEKYRIVRAKVRATYFPQLPAEPVDNSVPIPYNIDK